MQAYHLLQQHIQKNPRTIGLLASLVGGFMILLSVPMEWEEAYVTGLGESASTSIFSGFFVVIEALVILGIVIFEFQLSDEKPTAQASIVAALCLMTLLFALFTLLGAMMVGTSSYGGVTAGIRTGPGLWLAIFGSLICAGGQALVVGFEPPLLTLSDDGRRCPKCGKSLSSEAMVAKCCPSCGGDWLSADMPPPIPNRTVTIRPKDACVSTRFIPTRFYMKPAIRRRLKLPAGIPLQSFSSTASSFTGRARKLIGRINVLYGIGLVCVVALGLALTNSAGFGPHSSTAADYTSNEVREIIRLLREDTACRDTRIEDFAWNRNSLELWEAVLGKPTATNGSQYSPNWTYKTSDGVVTVHVGINNFSGDTPIVVAIGNGHALGLNANNSVDSDALKETILSIKSHVNPVDSLAFRQSLIEKAKEEDRQRELARQREYKQQLKKRDEEHQAAKHFAASLFRNAPLTPRLLFSNELGVGEASVQPAEDAEALIEVLRQGTKHERWQPYLELFRVHHGRYSDINGRTLQDEKFTRNDIKKAYGRMLMKEDDYMVFVPTQTDLDSASLIFVTDDNLYRAMNTIPHPSKNGWLLAWHPLMKEGFVVPTNYEVSKAFRAAKAEVGRVINANRDRMDVGKPIPNDVRKVVREQYDLLKQRFLGGEHEPKGPTPKSPSDRPAHPSIEMPERKQSLVRQFTGHSGVAFSVDISPDGKTIISGGEGEEVILWNIASGEEIARLKGVRGSVRAVAFSDQGDQILAATLDHAVFLWDAKTREQTRELHFETPAIYDAAFSPDGQRVAGGTYVGVAYVFDATSGERLLKFKAHKRSRRFEDVSIPGLDISPDGHMLATASSDESVRIWNMRDGKSIGRFDGHESDVWCVTFSPDGGRALSGAKSGELYLWDTTTGQAIHELRGHNGNVFAAEFLPDGNRAITGSVSSDGNVLILWNLESGKAIKQFPEQISGVSGIAVAPNGRSFVTAGVDGVIRLFHLPAPDAND